MDSFNSYFGKYIFLPLYFLCIYFQWFPFKNCLSVCELCYSYTCEEINLAERNLCLFTYRLNNMQCHWQLLRGVFSSMHSVDQPSTSVIHLNDLFLP